MRWASGVAAAVGSLAAATLVAAGLHAWAGIDNTSSVYLLSVAGVALVAGTAGAVATAIGAFVLYNFLFVDPRFSLAVAEPQSVLTLLLLLVIGVVVGRLTSLGRDRAVESARREREARALFAITRALATGERSEDALATVAERIAAEAEMDRVWIGLGITPAQERVAGDTDPGADLPVSTHVSVLHRDPAEASARWTRIHAPAAAPTAPAGRPAGEILRVELTAGDERLGALYALRRGRRGDPPLETSRLLAVAADQVAQALRRDRLARRALDVEVAERSDAAKSALLDLVSHELRTPLSAIRAAAGSLADPALPLSDDQRRALAEGVDAEAMRLNRLVGNLLDMSRLRAGRVTPRTELIPLADAVEAVVARLQAGGRAVEHHVAVDLPPVEADAMFLERVLTNLLENAVRHAPPGAPIRLAATPDGDIVEITVEDGGPGVPGDQLERIFEPFVRDPDAGERTGIGLGLALVAGLVEAMRGTVSARRSDLGGLAVIVRLPSAGPPP